ncbi:InlB B-repeat-containing protein [Cellvibrio sp. OA-2007]|uniref:InlB B-repeat-containing protein n=1 Tax=Cellvibrio sp. OA-2007 TaxID=529823 RepID=UPI00078374B9|nr:hypothetical protein [Cellvibrio sp. OA-2007]
MASSPLKLLAKVPVLAGLLLTAQAALAGTLTGVSVTPADNTAGATTSYTFTYTTESNLNADTALFYVTFPAGFSVATGACDRITSFTLNPDPGGAICRASYGSGETVGFAVNTGTGGGVSVPGSTQVTVVVGGVTNPATPGDYVFTPGGGIGSSTGIYTAEMADPMFPFELDVAAQQTVTIGTSSAVNGACGSAVGGVFSTAPAADLCAAGAATAVTSNPTTYTWGCNGTGGGTDTAANACSANKGYDLILSISPNSSGSVSCTNDPVIHGGNTTCTPTASPGYSFNNWTGDCSGATCILNNVTSSLNPQANFTLNQYAITTAVSPAPAGTATCTSNPVDHGSDTSCTYTTNPGYTFANWSGDCTGATCDLNGVTGAKSVTANFTSPTFNITVNTSGSGTASCSPNPVNGGSNSTCTASANTGYSFTGWSGDCSGGSCVLTSVASAKTVTANFSLNSYSISGSASPSAGGSVSCDGSVSHGSNGSCIATANTGYTFNGWTGCPSASGNNCSFTNVTSSQSVTANFTINSYSLTAVANPIDAGSVTCTSPVNHGNSASCTANPAAGYRLKEWAGACTGSSCAIASVTANSSVTATFELLPTYSVSTSVSPAGAGFVTCSKDVMEGGTATCTAKANDGYRFASWGGDCAAATTSTCTMQKLTSNKTVSAAFDVASTFTITASMQSILGNSTSLPILVNGVSIASHLRCSANPVSLGKTVSCRFEADILSRDVTFKGWGGECTKVEGQTCIIENMSTDKHLTVYTGILYNSRIVITPAGAGSVWCDKDLLGIFSGIDQSYVPLVQEHCKVVPNVGYELESITDPARCAGASCPVANANFKQKSNTPVVTCESCNASTTVTNTTTTDTASKTSAPDNQGNRTQTNVATTTNTQSGVATTSVTVGAQSSDGTLQPGGSVSTNDLKALVTVGEGSTTLLTNNPVTGNSSKVVITTSGTTISASTPNSADFNLGTMPGSNMSINQTTQGTVIQVADSATGTTLGTTTILGNTSTTSTADGSTLVSTAASGNSGVTSSFYGAGTVLSSGLMGGASYTATQCTSIVCSGGSTAGLGISGLSGAGAGGTGGFSIGLGQGTGGFSGGTTSVTLGSGQTVTGTGTLAGTGASVNLKLAGTWSPGNKPGMRKTSAAEDERKVFVDITGDALQSVQIFTQASGLVEVFKPEANGPALTKMVVNGNSLDMTLTFPAAK